MKWVPRPLEAVAVLLTQEPSPLPLLLMAVALTAQLLLQLKGRRAGAEPRPQFHWGLWLLPFQPALAAAGAASCCSVQPAAQHHYCYHYSAEQRLLRTAAGPSEQPRAGTAVTARCLASLTEVGVALSLLLAQQWRPGSGLSFACPALTEAGRQLEAVVVRLARPLMLEAAAERLLHPKAVGATTRAQHWALAHQAGEGAPCWEAPGRKAAAVDLRLQEASEHRLQKKMGTKSTSNNTYFIGVLQQTSIAAQSFPTHGERWVGVRLLALEA